MKNMKMMSRMPKAMKGIANARSKGGNAYAKGHSKVGGIKKGIGMSRKFRRKV